MAIENLIGSPGADQLRGNAAANTIEAGAGNDWVDGGAGDDWIEGGSGDDVLQGGSHGCAGDLISYIGATAGVTVNLALTSPQATGGAGTDTISGFENLTGSRFADTLTGSAGPNALQGGEGNDLIWGSAGADRHSGGPGADQFLYRSEAETCDPLPLGRTNRPAPVASSPWPVCPLAGTLVQRCSPAWR